MVKKFALMDERFNVIGTIALPDYLDFNRPHHSPHAEIAEGDECEVGMVQLRTGKFVRPGIVATVARMPEEISHDEKNRAESDPPLPDGKRSKFTFFRRRK